ncbi:hypothetical protein V1511DRAFT_521715 [Dipodascopsis uninucleata]
MVTAPPADRRLAAAVAGVGSSSSPRAEPQARSSQGRNHPSFTSSLAKTLTRQLSGSQKKDKERSASGNSNNSNNDSGNNSKNNNGNSGSDSGSLGYKAKGSSERQVSTTKADTSAEQQQNQTSLTTSVCICCLTSLRYPTTIRCFRCTVCQTTNDLDPLTWKSTELLTANTLEYYLSKESLSDEEQNNLEELVVSAFQSFETLNSSFKNDKEYSFKETGLDFSLISKFYNLIGSCTKKTIVQSILKASESLLRRPGKILSSPNDLRALLIILENPSLYAPRSSTTSDHHHTPSAILKRLLGLLSGLNITCHHYLVNWFARLPTESFKAKVELINSFTTHRLAKYVSAKGGAKIELYGHDWRIRAAARSLSLFFAANIQVSKIPTSSFYNTMVDYIDITHDFDVWEKQGIPTTAAPINRSGSISGGHGNSVSGIVPTTVVPKAGLRSESNSMMSQAISMDPNLTQASASAPLGSVFTFCQYPFYMSMGSKITILEYDARRQMEIKAREAFFSTLNYKRVVQPHLVLKVRRDCLIEDSLRQISSNEMDLKKGLKIEFIGEDGVDAGGLRKEWFLLLVREMFDPLNGMFIYEEDSNYCWFNSSTFETSDQYFLVGVVLGLAIYNSTILDIQLPPAVFKKLLGCQCTMEDLALLKPTLAKGLQQLLDFKGNVEETFCRDFVAEHEIYGTAVQVPLVPGGEKKPVTNANRHEFVNKYIQFIFENSIARQFQPFKRGFYHVIGGNALTLFRPEEIELLVHGSDEGLDVGALRAVAIYDGWLSNNNNNSNHGSGRHGKVEANELVVTWFWEFFENMEPKDQRRLLTFVTGSDRIPATGIANLIFKISRLGDDYMRQERS